MKRKHKSYSRPKRPFEKARIDQEAQIKKQFGLKNKREIWKAEASIKKIREKAKKLISAKAEEQQEFFERLNKIGLDVKSIADVLSLEKEDYMKRRLQTVVFNKKLAKTINSARQIIVHKKVLIAGRAVNIPSYVVPVSLEGKITIKPAKKKAPKEKPAEEETKPEEVKADEWGRKRN